MTATEILTAVSLGGGVILLLYKILDSKIDKKQDRSACIASHNSIEKDLAGGEKRFNEIIKIITDLKDQLSQNNTQLAVHNEVLKSIKELVEDISGRRDDRRDRRKDNIARNN